MKHFLALSDLAPSKITELLELGFELKQQWEMGGNSPLLYGKTLAMTFQKPSLRTRVSFEVGMYHLGGRAITLSPDDIKMGGREEVPDIARVLSGYVDGIMARTYSHNVLETLAAYASVPVINGLSDYNHPAQALTDLFTIQEHFGRLEGLKLAYVGDGNNVARSLLIGSAKTGMHVTIAAPDGYQLLDEDLQNALSSRIDAQQEIQFVTDPREAVDSADVVYTDVWTSMGQETESAERLRIFPPYQINRELMAYAKPTTIVLHCLPAHRGEEITTEIADGENSLIFIQAENRLHAQKAVLAMLLGDQ